MTVRTLQQLARDSHDTLAQITNPDTLDRARARIQMTIKAFYDDEPSEPVQALGDLVADVFHEAQARGLDLDAVLEHAIRIYEGEVADWEAPEEATITREQLLDAAASEAVSFRIGEPEIERAHLAGMSALIAQLTVGEGRFTDVQNEIYDEIERRAIARGAPYAL